MYMSYEDKLGLVRNSIITQCKDRVSENWLQMFDMWLSCEADMVFYHIYISAIKEEFAKYVTPEIETLLWISGKNIVYAISTYMGIKKDATLYEFLQFVEEFVSKQLDDFDNWCEDIGMAIYEESSEYKTDSIVFASLITEDEKNDKILDTLSKTVITKIKTNIKNNNTKDIQTLGRKGTLTIEQYMAKIKKQKGKCYVCLQDFKYDGSSWCNFFPSADRIDNNDIHRDGNIAIACTYCNIRMWRIYKNYATDFSKKICGVCPSELKHSFLGVIKTKSELFYELGNSDSRMYEYANNLPSTSFTHPSQV